MTRGKGPVLMGASLLGLSAVFYFLHYAIFRDAHHIFIYLVGDVAFVFIEVLLVTLIIHRVLEENARRSRLKKLNIVIGVFFSEVGTALLRVLAQWDPNVEQLRADLPKEKTPHGPALSAVRKCLQGHEYRVDPAKVAWERVRTLLAEKRACLLRLLENPNLLEHESFTNLLWAVFHLLEELQARPAFDALPDADRQHLGGDVKRVYGQLALQWLAYMEHLEADYPYLFSLALRTNPLETDSSAVVVET